MLQMTFPARAARIGAVQAKAILKLFPAKPAAKVAVSKPTTSNSSSNKNRFKQATGLPAPAINGKQFPVKLGFTAENELFVGRLAMLGFASALVGELLTSKGALAQFGIEAGLNAPEVDGLVLFLIAFNLIAAVLPTSQTFVPEEQEVVKDRPAGPLQDPRITILEPRKFFGLRQDGKVWGWTKENELFVGRTAQLGFAFALIGELLTGKGPLAQFDIETGISLRDTEAGLAAFILFFFVAAINAGSGRFVDKE